MRKIKTISAIGLAVILMAIVTSVSACAKTQDPASFAVNYAEGILWAYLHPREAVNISSAMLSRDNDPRTLAVVENSEGAQKCVNAVNLVNSIAEVAKTGLESGNPQNANPEKALILDIKQPIQYAATSENGKKEKKLEYNLFSYPLFYKNKITFDPSLAFKTSNNQLVVLAVMKNYSNQNVEISNIPEIQLSADGKQIAAGQTTGFKAPVRLSYYQKKSAAESMTECPLQSLSS